jgi:OOP family OmpA-OmpF porin
MKRIALFITAMLLTLCGHAQRNYKPAPYMFVTVQGGATRTFTNSALDRKWAPMGAISVGGYIAPFLGARVQGNGWMWDEDKLDANGTYNNKWYGGNADLLVNLTGIIFPKRNNLLNVVAIAGYGLQYAKFDACPTSHRYPLNERGNRWTHNTRLAGQLDLNIAKHFSVLLEGGYDLEHDHVHNFKVEKWWPYAMLGLSYKFGHPKVRTTAPLTTPVVQEIAEDANANVAPATPVVEEKKPEPVVEEKKPEPVVQKVPEKQAENIFFLKGSAAIGNQQATVINSIAQWAKDHPQAIIQLTGYADKGTGTARVNQAISERRAAAVKDALVRRGIKASRIATEAKGDTEQPFADNDQNRAVIAISEEK